MAAHHLGISCEEAESILNEMYMLRLVRDIVAETPKGMLHVYRRLEDTALIPFLYTATELMRAQPTFWLTEISTPQPSSITQPRRRL